MDTKQIAADLESEYMAVSNGDKKPSKIALEPMVRAVQELRRLTTRPLDVPQTLEGWHMRMDPDAAVVIEKDGIGAAVLRAKDDEIAGTILYHLVCDMLGASVSRAVAAPGNRIVESGATLMDAPFADCSFCHCDLLGQCKEEGACHHPARGEQHARADLTECQQATLLACQLRFEAEGNMPMAADIRAVLAAGAEVAKKNEMISSLREQNRRIIATAEDLRKRNLKRIEELEQALGNPTEQRMSGVAHDAAAPRLTAEQWEDIAEGREILTDLIENIEKDGAYSAEATCTFVRQALNCLPGSIQDITTDNDNKQHDPESIEDDFVFALASRQDGFGDRKHFDFTGPELLEFVKTIRATTPRLVARSARQAPVARPLGEWHEDHGNAVWFTWQDGEWLGEPSYIGQPNDSDWPGYHTHWVPHPAFPAPARTYTTRLGDSVVGIASRQCGDDAYWRSILECNPEFEGLLADDYFPVGTVLMLPSIAALPQPT